MRFERRKYNPVEKIGEQISIKRFFEKTIINQPEFAPKVDSERMKKQMEPKPIIEEEKPIQTPITDDFNRDKWEELGFEAEEETFDNNESNFKGQHGFEKYDDYFREVYFNDECEDENSDIDSEMEGIDYPSDRSDTD